MTSVLSTRRLVAGLLLATLLSSCGDDKRRGLWSIAVTPADPSIAAGSSQTFIAMGTYRNGVVQDLTDSVTWSSTSPDVATVDQGIVSGLVPGTTIITATDLISGLSGSAELTVTSAVLVSLSLSPTSPQIALGTSLQIQAMGIFSDQTVQDLTGSVAWSSSDPAVASVNGGLAQGTGVGVASITASAATSGVVASTTLTVTDAVLVSIDVTPTNPSIALGTDQQCTATGTYSDSSTQDLTDAVTWSSAFPAIATVSNAPGSEGLATSVAAGMTAVMATDPATAIGGSTTLTVTPAVLVSIAVTPANPSIALGTDQQCTATGTYSDGSTQDLTYAATWTSTSPAVATVSNAPGSEGLATSVAVGMTTLTATDPATTIGGSTTLTVTPAVLVSIAVTPVDPWIALGTSQQCTATGTYSDSSTQDLTDAVTWTSTSPAIATVSNAPGSEGLATSVSLGVTTLTAIDPGTAIQGWTTLTVTPAVLVSVTVTPTDPSVAVGASLQFTATGTYSDSSTQDLTDAVTWSSSNPAVATVSNAGGSEGLAAGVSTGSTSITATDAASGIDDSTSLGVTKDITFRAASSTGLATGLNLTVSTPVGTQSGDALVAAIAVRPSSATITPPNGWTLVRRIDNSTGNSNSLALYRRLAIVGEPADHTWVLSTSTGSVGGIASFCGVDPASPIDGEDGQSTPSSLTHDTPSVLTTRSGTMLLTSHAFSSSASWTPPIGMSEALEVASLTVPNAAGISLELNHALQPAAGPSGVKSATASTSSDTGNAHILALSPEN